MRHLANAEVIPGELSLFNPVQEGIPCSDYIALFHETADSLHAGQLQIQHSADKFYICRQRFRIFGIFA
ncbi:hypothetical protein D3C86_1827090 [compost metagenome]